MASFDQTGQPTGYDQIQPNLDLPKPPQQQQRPSTQYPQLSPLTTAITQPAQYPGDASMIAWRQGAAKQQPLGQQAPSMATGSLLPSGAQQFGPGQRNPITGGTLGPNEGGSISAPMPFNNTAPNAGAQQTSAPQQPQQNLSDPSTWMSMVGNQPALTNWVKQGLGPKADDSLVNYYVGKIQGQPGANAQEQQGSAAYWLNKLQNDPNVTGRPAMPQQPRAGISPMQQATLFGRTNNSQATQQPDLQSLIVQLLQQSTGGGAPPTIG